MRGFCAEENREQVGGEQSQGNAASQLDIVATFNP
jgi:hypothetical protein